MQLECSSGFKRNVRNLLLLLEFLENLVVWRRLVVVYALVAIRSVSVLFVAGARASDGGGGLGRQPPPRSRPSYLNLNTPFIAVLRVTTLPMDSRLKQLEKQQKLYSLLKAQHEAEVKELMHYMSVLTTVENNLVRSYLHSLLSDGLRHIEYISRIMADIEGATGSASLTKKGIQESIADERESHDALLRCAEMADDPETAALLKSISVDEEHHIRILEHLSELVESAGAAATATK